MAELDEISTHSHDGVGSQKIKSFNVIPTLTFTTAELETYLSRPAINGDEFNVYISDAGIYRKYFRANDLWIIISGSDIDNYFGSGEDGDVIITTNTSLDSDKFYSNLTIEDGVTLNPNGYRIFVGNITKFIGTGKIARNGNDGGTVDTKAGGAALADGTIAGGLAGGNGGSGGEYSGGGSNGYPGSNGVDSALSILNTAGKNGGKGGDSKINPGDTPNTGGGGGVGGTCSSTENATFELKKTYTLSTLTLDSENEQAVYDLTIVKGVTSGETLSLTASGGGGGGGATIYNQAVGGNGGGAGGNGGIIYLASPIIITVDGNNFMEAKGGKGADGNNGLSTVPIKTGGGGGGGAGGNGGLAIVIYKSLIGGGTISVAGGTGGTGGQGASDNTAANPDGANGQNGNNGKYIKIKIS